MNNLTRNTSPAVLFLCLVAACKADPNDAPKVTSTTPADADTNVPINASAIAEFNVDMDGATLTPATFTVTFGDPPVAIAGTVITSEGTAVFWPSAHLASDTAFTATITTDVGSAAGVLMDEPYTWGFTTGDALAPGLPVNLGTAGEFAILAKSGISTVPASAITGDIGVSPAAASFLTGFSLTADASNEFATSPQVTGHVFAADYSPPTPSDMTVAVSDMELAFTDAAGRAPDVTELGAGDIGGMTLPSGVYKWGTGLLIPTSVTLDGSASDVWIFQVAQDLIVSSGANIVLAGGAQPKNVYWQVAGLVDVGTTAHLEGIVLTQTSVTLRTGASINGRLLAQTAVDLDQNVVVEPAP